ncbi:hypothetical protein K435DRAFT_789708 [Dendrothele bispora CBS 962.96]|uniref:Uncharacterized protein n=1 Tax=Dendrothele bispora (strain CBS 962.96) TaxID=1314807 RepID=A0A4S8MTE1_DENBC|nr:hypothetical protein K435DRAFT_789708 [Dendrothele bispora CBS 962.96]
MAPGPSRNTNRSGSRRAPRGNNAEGPVQSIAEDFERLDSASELTESPLTTPGMHSVTLDPDPSLGAHIATPAVVPTGSDPSVPEIQSKVIPPSVPVIPPTHTSTSQSHQAVTELREQSSVRPDSPTSSRPTSPVSISSSDSDSLYDIIMTTSVTSLWVNNGAGRLPTINNRHLEPLDLFNVFSCVEGYYINKEYDETDSKKARNAFFSCFTAPGSVHFFAANRSSLLSMSPTEYKHAIYKHILGEDWESDVHSRIFSTKQASVEDKSFEVLVNTIGAYNSMLTGTPSAVDDVGLLGAFYASFTPEFARYLDEKGVKRSLTYKVWLVEVSKHDLHFRKFIQPKIDELNTLRAAAAAASTAPSHPPLAPAFSHNAPRSGSRQNLPAISSRPPSASSNSFMIPKMSESETAPLKLPLSKSLTVP